jgi:hypothetical protein
MDTLAVHAGFLNILFLPCHPKGHLQGGGQFRHFPAAAAGAFGHAGITAGEQKPVVFLHHLLDFGQGLSRSYYHGYSFSTVVPARAGLGPRLRARSRISFTVADKPS